MVKIFILQLSLTLMQRLIVADVVDANSGEHVVETLWMLMETGIEELKVLQTVTLLLTTSAVIQGATLAKVWPVYFCTFSCSASGGLVTIFYYRYMGG